MAYVRLASLILFLLATFSMFLTKKVKATDCSGACSPFEMPPCRSLDCRCIPVALFGGYCTYPSYPNVMNMVREHSKLCQSHVDCLNKKSGRFCARYPNPDIEYGWCFDSNTEAQEVFFKMSSNSEILRDFLKMCSSA
ncbi:unnamed protein product [Vicia faba]|uniref:Albumin I chain a domain-containing protein n=1 Tax=Vicia faba TaxID=3906 RepID=A0AAV1AK30_VICFA|nr:unnamed protein product [Vicia faba]